MTVNSAHESSNNIYSLGTGESIQNLRAVRNYSDKTINDETVTRWIESARWCGSSKNSQPWSFNIVRDKETLQTLSQLGAFAIHLAEANLAIVIAMENNVPEFSQRFDLGRISQSLMLLAHSDGIGSCVAVFEPAQKMREVADLLHAPDDTTIDMAIGFGYPTQDQITPTTPRVSPKGRKSVEELVSYEYFYSKKVVKLCR